MKYYYLLSLILFLASCKKEEKKNNLPINEKGFFIVNEGNYTWGNSSLSFYNETNKTLTNQLFFKKNDVPLGDVATSMLIIENNAFITINNSGRIYVVDAKSCEYKGKISELVSPRHLLQVSSNEVWVSDLYSTEIIFFNPHSFEKIGYLDIGFTSESLLNNDNEVWLSSWSHNNKIIIVDKNSKNIIHTIVTRNQPKKMTEDKNGKIWVLCDGGYYGSPTGHEEPSFQIIDKITKNIEKTIIFPNKNNALVDMTFNKTLDSIFFIHNHIYAMGITDSLLPSQPLIFAEQRNFYCISITPNNNQLVISDAKNWASDGDILIYNTNGNLVNTFKVGINPGYIYHY